MNRPMLSNATLAATVALVAAIGVAAGPSLGSVPRGRPTPMVAEMLALVESERVQVAELRGALAGVRDAARALELQRRIERVKVDTEVSLLRVQIGYAQREGRSETAARLQRTLNMVLSPPGPGQASVRPTPSAR